MKSFLKIVLLVASGGVLGFPAPAYAGDWPFRFWASSGQPNTLEQVAHSIDSVEKGILFDGVVTIKQPDVYGQSRMTLYRKNFEQQLYGAINNFNVVLSARVARSDQAAFLSQSNLQATLSTAPAPRTRGRRRAPGGAAGAASSSTTNVINPGGAGGSGSSEGDPSGGGGAGIVPDALATGSINRSAPFSGLGGQPFSTIGTPYGLGLEPTVYLDQLANFQNHLNDIRRINMGDDIADSAGYGLYLLRVPVSILPGHCTQKGHGAVLTATLRHEFGPEFLPATFRNLVINDLVDQLSPVVYELIRSGAVRTVPWDPKSKDPVTPDVVRERYRQVIDAIDTIDPRLLPSLRCYTIFLSDEEVSRLSPTRAKVDSSVKEQAYRVGMQQPISPSAPALPPPQDSVFLPPDIQPGMPGAPETPGLSPDRMPPPALSPLPPELPPELRDKVEKVEKNLIPIRGPFEGLTSRMSPASLATSRPNDRTYPIAPSEIDNAFIQQNLMVLAINAATALRTRTPRASDVRAFLRGELESAYDVISQIYRTNELDSANIVARFEENLELVAQHYANREFYALYDDYYRLTLSLPGLWRYLPKGDPYARGQEDYYRAFINPTTILCYAIAFEAGLLDRQLRIDMKRVFGKDRGDCAEIDVLRFYSPCPSKEAQLKFEEYVKRRWPMITFALDPFVDEQNIADATSVRRDLQLALAFAFSSGQINFRQLLQFQRRLEFDAETIALNRTVASFAAGDDTFGFRFTPRYQNPPPERSNLHVLYNQIVKGGPGPDYQIKNSKLEPGQRELTVVAIMPSFLQEVAMDVTGNFFPLLEPDRMKMPTPTMIARGRQVVELNQALAGIHDHKLYRPGDVQRLETRVHQLETMLPMQTRSIHVPYENTLGGFQLFQQGVTSLVPQLDGFEGLDTLDTEQDAEVFLYGKHFSVQETQVVVGGKNLSAVDLDAARSVEAAKASIDAAKAGHEAAQATLQVTVPMPAASPSPAPAGGGSATEPAGGDASSTAADKVSQAQAKSQAASQKLTQASSSHMDSVKKSLQASQSKSAGTTVGAGLVPGPTTPSNPAVDVISREVIRVSIPAGTLTTLVKGAEGQSDQLYVEAFVATPNGISNRLLIPAKPKPAEKSGTTTGPAPGYTLKTTSVTITYQAQVQSDAQGRLHLTGPQYVPDEGSNRIEITLEEPLGLVPVAINARFDVTFPGASDSSLQVQVDGIRRVRGVYAIEGENFRSLAEQLRDLGIVQQVVQDSSHRGVGATLVLTPSRVEVPGFDPIGKKAANSLTVQFRIRSRPTAPAGPPPPAGGGAFGQPRDASPRMDRGRPSGIPDQRPFNQPTVPPMSRRGSPRVPLSRPTAPQGSTRPQARVSGYTSGSDLPPLPVESISN